MNQPHQKIITTYPVAIKHGQGGIHIPDPIPWHVQCEHIKCPDCETIFIVTSGFPKLTLLQTLKAQHLKDEEHPEFIPSAPEWTTVTNCDCKW